MALSFYETRRSGGRSQNRDGHTRVVLHGQVKDPADMITVRLVDEVEAVLFSFNTRVSGTNAYLSEWDIQPEEENRAIWYATLTFETPDAGQQAEAEPDPVDQNALVYYEALPEDVPFDKAYGIDDEQGSPSLPVQNPVGDEYDPPLLKREDRIIIIVEKNYNDFPSSDMAKYINTVNATTITIGGVTLAAKAGYMRDIRMQPGFKTDNTRYDRMHFEIVLNKETWARQPLARGYYHYSTPDDDSTYKPILNKDVGDGDDKEVTEPQKLLANGGLVLDGTPYFQEFEDKFAIAWGPLDLPAQKDGRR